MEICRSLSDLIMTFFYLPSTVQISHSICVAFLVSWSNGYVFAATALLSHSKHPSKKQPTDPKKGIPNPWINISIELSTNEPDVQLIVVFFCCCCRVLLIYLTNIDCEHTGRLGGARTTMHWEGVGIPFWKNPFHTPHQNHPVNQSNLADTHPLDIRWNRVRPAAFLRSGHDKKKTHTHAR